MVNQQNDKLLNFAAWPIRALYKSINNDFIGFIMPKIVEYKEIHKLYSPKSRISEFNNATWTFLVHVATNLARTFNIIHHFGYVIGDINHSNFLIAQNGLVKVIDCDSFQIKYNDKLYLCEVGVSTHQPPELQGINSFHNIERTPNHDNFGLAVLIFQILFMGRHPFSGRYFGHDEMPLEKAIKEFRFAYGRQAKSYQMEQPPHSLPFEAISPPLENLFERSFLSLNNTRPTPEEWTKALEQLSNELKRCTNDQNHFYHRTFPFCPWCKIETDVGVTLFGYKKIGEFEVGNIEIIWQKIANVQSPGIAENKPNSNNYFAEPTIEVLKYVKQKKLTRYFYYLIIIFSIALCFINFWVAILVFFISMVIISNTSRRQLDSVENDINQKYKEVDNKLTNLEVRWRSEAEDTNFKNKKHDLENIHQDYINLPALRQRKINELQSQKQKIQLEAFLDKHYIVNAKIPNIGPGRKATLQSYGIFTAADINVKDIYRINGFGSVYTNNLLDWRKSIEIRFKYNPQLPIDPNKIVELDRDINAIKDKLERKLINGLAELKNIAEQTIKIRPILYYEFDNCLKEFAQARANKNAFKI